ncbi:hypothetical protein SF1_02310 [Sphingobacterium faecium NBRC 15299]|uniref:hypothetical protein n=1 Tax=Sphingobacterium faecium TaxID=34087 RepID=UPI000D3C820A|nr:hypothetical protein [Sphingobacterium faecium]PTX12540.1 hypothetical protein C8N37_102234 [Sphingobacterium faecium]GEM62249.1 hypothetical protein SF1_02310 [Sphingobacterium faecium NBRC 15299]
MRTLLKRAIGATSVCVLAAGMVFGAHAFTKKADNKVSEEKNELAVKKTDLKSGEQWFIFMGGDPNSPSNYQLHSDGTQSPSECVTEETEVLCSLKAQPSASNPNQPNLATTIESRYTPEN